MAVEVSGKSVLVTGAGSGIGRAAAVEFARRGARLTLSGRREEPLKEVAALVEEAGGEAQVVAGDVAERQAREWVVRAATERFGGLDVLVNNAGNVRAGRLEEIGEEDIRAQIEVNLTAPILLTREALAALRDSGEATVVNVSSGFGLAAMPFYSAYGATETPMMETNEAGPELGFSYESAEEVARALVEGVEAGELNVVRGAEDRTGMAESAREDSRAADAQISSIKDDLEAAVSGHRSI